LSGRAGSIAIRSQSTRLARVGGPIHVEDLDPDQLNPFHDDEQPQHHRWLITTCVAGMAGSLVIGTVLLGVFSTTESTGPALASVNPAEIWQRPALSMKSNYKSIATSDNPEPSEVAELKPYSEVSVVFRQRPAGPGPGEAPADDTAQGVTGAIVIPARALTGGQGGAYPSISADALPYGSPQVIDGSFQVASLDTGGNITVITKTLPEPVDETITLPGDGSLADEIAKLGVTIDQANALASAIEPVFPTTLLKAGQQFTVTLERQLDFYGQDAIVPVRLSFSPGPNEEIVVEADEDGRFIARVDGAQEGTRSRYAESPYYRARAKVGAGLYSTAKDNGVPDYIVTQMMQVFAYDVDFQRQVKADDTFEIFYGNPLTGSSTKRKVVHYTSLTVDGETKGFFRFTTPDGETSYYDENGRSADRDLLRTPVPGSRISSGFGMRRHPILGYNRMHTGVDFAAPYGTPMKAAGDGVITAAGWQGAYGKVVRIRHQNSYETIYAHMSRIPTTIKPGVAVRQGQVIGFVGSTGRSTGPHAHFEIRIDGKPVNPLKVKATGGRQLTGKNLAAFRQHMQKIVAMMKAAPDATRVAQAGN
jgi:murein DD-endopeptidase MepM/ murein hydrolase activator NlpD